MKKILPIIILILAGNFLPSLTLAENHDPDFYGFSDICSVPEIKFEYVIVLKSFRTSERKNFRSLTNQDNCHIQSRNMSTALSSRSIINRNGNRETYPNGNYTLPDSFNGYFRCDRAPPRTLSNF